MPLFRTKPVVIEAVQWTGENTPEILVFGNSGPCPLYGDALAVKNQKKTVEIETLEGTMTASPGDWIIRGVKGEFYPIKDAIFAATYEQVVDDQQAGGQS